MAGRIRPRQMANPRLPSLEVGDSPCVTVAARIRVPFSDLGRNMGCFIVYRNVSFVSLACVEINVFTDENVNCERASYGISEIWFWI